MLPKLSIEQQLAPNYLKYLNTLQQKGFSGDVETSYGARLAVATDNSVYQNLPQGVIFPKGTEDLEIALTLANDDEFKDLTFSHAAAARAQMVSHLIMG